MAAYNAYLWKLEHEWRLVHTARDIAARSRKQAAKRSVDALLCRPANRNNADLRKLKAYLNGNAARPSGIRLEIVQVANGPTAGL